MLCVPRQCEAVFQVKGCDVVGFYPVRSQRNQDHCGDPDKADDNHQRNAFTALFRLRGNSGSIGGHIRHRFSLTPCPAPDADADRDNHREDQQ